MPPTRCWLCPRCCWQARGGAFLYTARPADARPEPPLAATPDAPQACDLDWFYQTCFVDGVDSEGFRYPVLMRLFLAAHAEHPDAKIAGYGVGNPIRLELTDNGQPVAYCWDITPLLSAKQLVAGYYQETIERC